MAGRNWDCPIARTEPSERFAPLANVLRERRKAAGLSQAQVAAALGWRQSVVGDVELARRRLNVYELVDYANVLGCDPEIIFHEIVSVDNDADSTK
jgi:HTH-type transcriptional regulator/antitoxin HipB